MDIRRVVPNLKASAPLERSRQFYEGVIGLELAMDLGWIISFRSRSNPTAQLAVLLNDATAPVHPDVSVEVEDVDAVYRKAEGAGAEIIHPSPMSPGAGGGSSFAIPTELLSTCSP